MTTEELEILIDEEFKSCRSTLSLKAKEYAKEDRLSAFKSAASIQKCTDVGALAGMMAKHTISIYELCKDYDDGKSIPIKLWSEKITDHINYLLLLKMLIIEHHQDDYEEANS